MRYIGSKKSMAGSILQAVRDAGAVGGIFADLFTGTGAVARSFKLAGFQVIAADLLTFPYVLQRAYIKLSAYPQFIGLTEIIGSKQERDVLNVSQQASLFGETQQDAAYKAVLTFLNELPGCSGYVYRHYTEEGSRADKMERRYYTETNAQKIDAIRGQIQEWHHQCLVTSDEFNLLLATLLEAMPNVANVLGTYGAFKKGDWEPRAKKMLTLMPLSVTNNGHDNMALCGDANELVREIECDVLYLDPPYNARQYALYYHLLETVAVGDEPMVAGITGKPVTPRPSSRYCNAAGARERLRDLVRHARCQHIFMSYSSEGLIQDSAEISQILALRGEPSVMTIAQHKRYRSDQDRVADGNGGRKRNYAPNTTVEEKLFHVAVVRDAPLDSEEDMPSNEGFVE